MFIAIFYSEFLERIKWEKRNCCEEDFAKIANEVQKAVQWNFGGRVSLINRKIKSQLIEHIVWIEKFSNPQKQLYPALFSDWFAQWPTGHHEGTLILFVWDL